jgi:hypothetical protein
MNAGIPIPINIADESSLTFVTFNHSEMRSASRTS